MTPISALPAAEFDEKRREVMYGLRTHGASGLSLDAYAIIKRQAAELSNIRSSLNDARSNVTELDDALGEADARCANLRSDLAECTARHNEAVVREENVRADFKALQRALVGDTGASAILTAGKLRAALEKAREFVDYTFDYGYERHRVPMLLVEIDAALGAEKGE